MLDNLPRRGRKSTVRGELSVNSGDAHGSADAGVRRSGRPAPLGRAERHGDGEARLAPPSRCGRCFAGGRQVLGRRSDERDSRVRRPLCRVRGCHVSHEATVEHARKFFL